MRHIEDASETMHHYEEGGSISTGAENKTGGKWEDDNMALKRHRGVVAVIPEANLPCR